MTEREALSVEDTLKLALEAFEHFYSYGYDRVMCEKAIIEIKETLAQPEQELLAWKNAALRVGEDLSSVGPKGYYNMTAQQWLDWAMAQQPRGNNSLAQPEQEPVAFASHGVINWIADKQFQHEADLYTTPYVATPLPTQPDLGAICQDLQEMTYNQAMRIAELEDKLKMALEALEEFGEHYNWCHQFPTYAFPENYPPCNCGYDEAITAIKNVLKMKEQP